MDFADDGRLRLADSGRLPRLLRVAVLLFCRDESWQRFCGGRESQGNVVFADWDER